MPPFSEDATAMIVLLGQQAAADVEDAAAACAGIGCRRDKDNNGRQRDEENRDESEKSRHSMPPQLRRQLIDVGADWHGNSNWVCARRCIIVVTPTHLRWMAADQDRANGLG